MEAACPSVALLSSCLLPASPSQLPVLRLVLRVQRQRPVRRQALAAGSSHRRDVLLRDGRPVRQRLDRNDTGGISGDRLQHGFDPIHRALPRRRSQGPVGPDRLHPGPRHNVDLADLSFKKAVQLEDGPSAGYHGYWVTDFTQIDPHLGTNDELRALVDAAHTRGMKVYFDIITNHTADVIGYQEGARTAYVPGQGAVCRTASGIPFDDRDYAGTNSFPPTDATESFPTRRRWIPASRPQGSQLAQRRHALPQPATRPSPARTPTTATSSDSTICSPSTPGWSTG